MIERKLSHFPKLLNSSDPKGVKSIPNFVCNLIDPIEQSPMDIMHVILEGVCRKQIMRIFDVWITTKRSTWDEIKSCLDNFDYGYTCYERRIKNFNEYDSKRKEFIASASQMATLLLLFPFIFSNIIDIDHEEYK